MLHLAVYGVSGDAPETLQGGLDLLRAHPALVEDLLALVDVLEERAARVTRPLSALPGGGGLEDVPLHLHASYSREEVLAAFGVLTPARRYAFREGVIYDETTNTDVFLVTVHKTEKHYSPTTMYRDYPISRELFHWESQASTPRDSAVGRRYLEGRSRILLMVRERRTGAAGTAPYVCLGPATLVDAKGERPIAITWRLQHPMPQTFYEAIRSLAA